MNIDLCYIRENYFISNPDFIKMLDSGNTDKQSKRIHLCLRIVKGNNTFYIPLRNNLGDEIRKYGRIGHSVPSAKRPEAGLDYRHALVINDLSYIEQTTSLKIPQSQYNILVNDYSDIEAEFTTYINGFIKAIKKNRELREPLYRESSLLNYRELLVETKNA